MTNKAHLLNDLRTVDRLTGIDIVLGRSQTA